MSDEPIDDRWPKITEAIGEATESSMVTKWVCVAETIMEDGTRELSMMSSPGSSVWDRIGLLEFHLQLEKGRIESC